MKTKQKSDLEDLLKLSKDYLRLSKEKGLDATKKIKNIAMCAQLALKKIDGDSSSFKREQGSQQVGDPPVTQENLNEALNKTKIVGELQSKHKIAKKFSLVLNSNIKNSQVDTDNNIIYIKSDQPITKVVNDVAWEFTNASNEAKFDVIHSNAKSGNISEKEYVLSKGRLEAEAQFNAIKAQKELGTSDSEIEKYYGEGSVDLYKQVIAKTLLMEDYKEQVAQSHYDGGKVTTKDGKTRWAREVYGEQYQKLRYGFISIDIDDIATPSSDNLGENSQWIKP